MNLASSSHQGASILDILLAYWWVFLLFGGAILEFFGNMISSIVGGMSAIVAGRHRRKVELRKLELKIKKASATAVAPSPQPGLCRHRKAVPVRDNEGVVVSWLCRSCDAQLPPEFSIYEEDL